MNFDEYQEKTRHTNVYPEDNMLDCLALGLCSEAGEVAGKVKKAYRDGSDGLRSKVKKELGDVLWYASEIATEFGLTLEEVAEDNIHKLKDRHRRGTINGEGDNR